MTKLKTPYRFLFGAGGTGGHLYPAIAVAQKIRELKPESDILFVGTKNKIEAVEVPKSGFKFEDIWIRGFSRKFNLQNILFPLQMIISFFQTLLICIKFNPRVTIGTGAYVAGPVVWTSDLMGSKAILLEQNSVPGITNRLLEKRAYRIFTSFDETKKFFRAKDKVVLSGNPMRLDLKRKDKINSLSVYDLEPARRTLLVLGGSLGALSINKAVAANLDKFSSGGIQLIWQTGKNYYSDYSSYGSDTVRIFPFIENMSDAYSAADLIIARAGATTIAELAYLGLAAILVPSPNVAGDHQTVNAESLVKIDAAGMIADAELTGNIYSKVEELIYDEHKLQSFKINIKKLSNPAAAQNIAEYSIKLAEEI